MNNDRLPIDTGATREQRSTIIKGANADRSPQDRPIYGERLPDGTVEIIGMLHVDKSPTTVRFLKGDQKGELGHMTLTVAQILERRGEVSIITAKPRL